MTLKSTKLITAVIAGIFAMSSLVFTPVFAATDNTTGAGETTGTSNNAETDGSSSGGNNSSSSGGGLTTAPSVDACAHLQDGLAREAAGCDAGENSDKLPTIVVNILNVVIGISSLVAVVFIIIGGLNFMTASGDPGKVKKAKDTILYACIGLVVCALAFAIVNWAISAINGNSDSATSSKNGATTNSSTSQ